MDNQTVAAQVSQAQTLMQSLMREIRDGSITQAALQTEIKTLRDSVEMLSTIIRGGGGGRSLLTEVELLKRQVADIEGKLDSMKSALTDKVAAVKNRIDEEDNRRRNDETVRMTLQQKDTADRRLDARQRLNTYATIIVALISLAGSILALVLRSS